MSVITVAFTDGTERRFRTAPLPENSDDDGTWESTVLVPAVREAGFDPDDIADWWVS